MQKPYSGGLSDTASADKWKRIGTHKRSGVLVPIFSIYSKNSVGIGDLDDLKILIDWCCKTGNSILQLLPMNDVGPTFCPYDATSSFALEPAYITLRNISTRNRSIKMRIEELKKRYPIRGSVDYRIKHEKLNLLWDIYNETCGRSSKELERFKEENDYWLEDFVLFKVIKYHQSGKPWYEWEDRYRCRDEVSLEDFRKEHEEEIMFHVWVQWQLCRQFTEAKSYAGSKKVLIKGDLPILISRDSADTWVHPEFFKLEFAAGAPPDMYCAKGQRWGMPPYNWERIRKDGYRYVKEKLKLAENFYDILRIDHVVGLFRIWSIPYNEPHENEGLNGFFDPKDEKIWAKHGSRILSVMLKSTKMLLCAEDLGIIPKACPKTIRKLGIPGNDVQRWMKDWKIKHDFLAPEQYRDLSVVMLSTHDTTNWTAWWEDEAGTVDEKLFRRKCADRRIDYEYVKDKLFDFKRSRHGRLRWLDSVASAEILIEILNKRKEDVMDFIDIYENSYKEKEKLWKRLRLKGAIREDADGEILREALKVTLSSSSIFCVELILDWLMMSGIFKGEPYQYRINTPGTISERNWSLIMPISLEELLEDRVFKAIKALVNSSGRN